MSVGPASSDPRAPRPAVDRGDASRAALQGDARPAAERADGFPAGTRIIELSLTDARQLFHSIDPSPFRERDLDPDAAEFIVGWARELPRDAALGLRITLAGSKSAAEEPAVLGEAVPA